MKKRGRLSVFQIAICAALIGGFAGGLSVMLPVPQQFPPYTPPTLTVPNEAIQQGRVIRVSDGDSITVRANNQNVKIRLAQIDAPERGQPWGDRSRAELAGLIAGKEVSIVAQGHDRYGRVIAHIFVAGKDVNQDMVQRGAAWAYPDYVRDPAILAAEMRARRARTGLWAMAESERQPPWQYRAQQRDVSTPAIGR